MKKVVIIGGGFIGLTSAYYLKKSGLDVTIIDKDEFGMACSKGNQGWIVPALHEPMPAPGLVTESLQMFLRKDSPLYVKPFALPKLSGWLTQFMTYCNEKDYRNGERALLTLSKSTLSFFDSLIEDGVEFELHKKGMIFAYLEEKNLQKRFKQFEEVANNFGHDQPVYKTKEEILAMEPGLSDNIIGGIYLKNQSHVRPESFSNGLINKIKEMGVNFIDHTEIIEVERSGSEIVAIKTKDEEFHADFFVIAAGAWSDILTKQINYKLPLTAGKGYSVTFKNPNTVFNHALYLADLSAGITPFNGGVRIGGAMELSGRNTKIDKKGVEIIRSAVSKYVKQEIQGDSEEEWAGMRPMTPDGLPVIGKIPQLNNMYIATGHGMIGLSMAPVTGKIISELIKSGESEYEIDAFSPNRFVKKQDKVPEKVR